MNFTYYGHACFAVEVSGKKLLFDPFITGNELAKDIDIKKIEADYILVSHGHGDHVADLMAIAHNTGATVISNAEITDWVSRQGYNKVHPMNFGSREFDFGKVYFVPAMHSSGLPDGSYGGNPGGFVIKTNEISFYYAGDTCLTMDMQLIPRYASVDVAILPIGGNFTMDAEDAVAAAEFVQCNKVVGVHFDTFGYIVIDKERAKATFERAGKELILPVIGTTITLNR
jgi:L-ascorbate metabolism protein UlaG (beta-lactamase superfamily)